MSDDDNQDKMPSEESATIESTKMDEEEPKTATIDSNMEEEPQAATTESKKELEPQAATINPSKEEAQAATSSKNVTYEDGVAIYTDEATKYKYKWCKDTNQWKPMENEHYKWDEEAQKWVPKASLENEYYRWCDKTNQWIPKMKQESANEAGVYGYDEKEACQVYTDQDGAVFFWVCRNVLLKI